jgi:phenylacetate-CoA ligase
MDLSYLYPREQCACGSWLRKIGPFAGRGDNMVKLRGINVWPEAVGDIATSTPGARPDYFVRAVRRQERDDLIVAVAAVGEPGGEALRDAVERRLHDALGVRIEAQIVTPAELDALTEVHTSPKPKRFRDERMS